MVNLTCWNLEGINCNTFSVHTSGEEVSSSKSTTPKKTFSSRRWIQQDLPQEVAEVFEGYYDSASTPLCSRCSSSSGLALGQCLHAKENRIREEGLIKDPQREKKEEGKLKPVDWIDKSNSIWSRTVLLHFKCQRFRKSVDAKNNFSSPISLTLTLVYRS